MSTGQIRRWSISGMPIFDAQGRFTGYCGIGRDTTKTATPQLELIHLKEMLKKEKKAPIFDAIPSRPSP